MRCSVLFLLFAAACSPQVDSNEVLEVDARIFGVIDPDNGATVMADVAVYRSGIAIDADVELEGVQLTRDYETEPYRLQLDQWTPTWELSVVADDDWTHAFIEGPEEFVLEVSPSPMRIGEEHTLAWAPEAPREGETEARVHLPAVTARSVEADVHDGGESVLDGTNFVTDGEYWFEVTQMVDSVLPGPDSGAHVQLTRRVRYIATF